LSNADKGAVGLIPALELASLTLHFFPVNAEANVINALEETSYHQGNWMVDDYLDSFQALVSDAGYIDL